MLNLAAILKTKMASIFNLLKIDIQFLLQDTQKCSKMGRLPTKVRSEPDSRQLETYSVQTLYSTAVKVDKEASKLRIYKMFVYRLFNTLKYTMQNE